MNIDNIEVYGFTAALRGMRNPMNSWENSDSSYGVLTKTAWCFGNKSINVPELMNIGPNDIKLACKLIKGGSEHRKFLRQIMIWMDITVPRYVWTELDTYKVSTVRNSCSTMHKLGSRDLTNDDFELPIDTKLLEHLNCFGQEFRRAKVIKDHKKMGRLRHEYKNILPEGFLQKATYTMNYETALSMYFQRRNHRLPEWKVSEPSSICSFIVSLPYMKNFIDATEKAD